ncbi:MULTISPECIES: DNA-binding protein [Pseudomonadaceae]|uniref:HrpZ protein n=1 Tax=Pseudomonas straminea TaxID=47882 RepID=A0A1I1WUF6_PSEOC|nr:MULTISPECIES: DNA-binding protein [Pseudomonas]TWE02953.1 HrpZ protein [Pseudomonas sp. AG1028]SFD98008.1 HrpZ protein [Pseudomonas straminea]
MNMVINRPAAEQSSLVGFTDRPLQGKNGAQGLEDVIKQLVQALLKAGGNADSGLGQMVKDKMSGGSGGGNGAGGLGGQAGGLGGGIEQLLTKILEQLISDKLGKDFGQSPAGGGGPGAAGGTEGGGAPGMGQQGGGDLLDRVLSGLAKSSLDGMLKPDGEGSKFEQKDAGMMMEVAKFMDANPQQFPPPDAGSWGKELIEDKHFNKSEAESFQSAIDMIGSQLDARASGQQVPGGASASGAAPGQDSLGGSGGLGSPEGNPGQAQGDILKELTQLLGGVVNELQNLTSKLESRNVEQGARDAADAIVNLMLPGGKQQA